MKNFNVDFVKLLSYIGVGLSLAATVVTGVAQEKSINKTITKEVAEAMKNQQ